MRKMRQEILGRRNRSARRAKSSAGERMIRTEYKIVVGASEHRNLTLESDVD